MTMNVITSFKKVSKKNYETFKNGIDLYEKAIKDNDKETLKKISYNTKKNYEIILILLQFENKPRFSIDMIQKAYLKVSRHFISEKNKDGEVNESDLTFEKNCFKCCLYLAIENGIYFDFGLQNGVLTFIKSKNNPFIITEKTTEDKKPKEKTEDEKLLECFEKCSVSINWKKVDKKTIESLISKLNEKIKK